MVKWLHRFANRRRPDEADEFGMAWRLLSIGGVTVSIEVHTKSEEDDDFRPNGEDAVLVLLHGAYVQHEVFPATNGSTITLCDKPFQWHHYKPNDLVNLRLLWAQTMEDTILDLPGWMSFHDVRRDTEKHAWFLAVRW